ncbi:MAG TPA: hypothetical protein PLX59_06290 [Candidatus Cloacimonadota bacterium]|nr:hypothetical protein [Candidatus Cloacimonadota bacterium]
MKDQTRKLLSSSYFISGSLHLLVLLILALIILKPVRDQIWHTFEWGEDIPEPIEQIQDPIEAPEADLPQQAENTDGQLVPQNPIPQNRAVEQVISQSPYVAPSLPTREEHIEAPRLGNREVSTPAPAPPREGRRVLPGANPGTNTGSGDGYEMLMGDGVVAERSPLPRVDYTDRVVLDVEFKLDAEGRIRMESLVNITMAPQTHLDATRAALRNWKFRFLGVYRPEQVYRIRFRFIPRAN